MCELFHALSCDWVRRCPLQIPTSVEFSLYEIAPFDAVIRRSKVRCVFSSTLIQLREPFGQRRRNEQIADAGCFELSELSDALGMGLQKL
jgi:hypothetical protein